MITVHADRQFTGELDLFNDREILVGGRTGEQSSVLRLGRASFRRLIGAEPDVGEIVMRAFILRRTGFIAHDQAGVTLLGHSSTGDAATALEAQLCDGEDVVVVCGGNSAGQAAVFLSRHARHVYLLVRGQGVWPTACRATSWIASTIPPRSRFLPRPRSATCPGSGALRK